MRLRNNIFAEAFKWLKKNWDGIKYQKDLAAKIGVSEDTITRIMRDQTEVTDDFLCKFNEAFDNVFNHQWLRGEDPFHMLMSDLINAKMEQSSPNKEEAATHQSSSYIDKLIASLEKQVKDKDDQLADKDRIIKLLEQKIEVLEAMQHLDSTNPLKGYPFPIGAADEASHSLITK